MSVIDDYQSGRAAAIPEEWNGTRYKSRFEAEVAQFLHWHFRDDKFRAPDVLTTIEYEPESFRLRGGKSFCPDFRISTTDGEHRLYVEARGYESEESNQQLDQFAEECRDKHNALFLVFFGDRVKLYERYYRYRDVKEAWSRPLFIRCPRCRVRTVAGVTWWTRDEATPGDQINLLNNNSDPDSDDIWMSGCNNSYPCHHCGLWAHCNLFDGHCFEVRVERGKINVVTLGALLVSIDSSRNERGWIPG